MKVREHRLPQQPCPLCGYLMDAATGITGDKAPEPGDFSVCIRCASPLRWTDDLKLRPVWAKEMRAIHPENRAQIERIMAAVRETDRRK